jgi:hypothetical protein
MPGMGDRLTIPSLYGMDDIETCPNNESVLDLPSNQGECFPGDRSL